MQLRDWDCRQTAANISGPAAGVTTADLEESEHEQDKLDFHSDNDDDDNNDDRYITVTYTPSKLLHTVKTRATLQQVTPVTKVPDQNSFFDNMLLNIDHFWEITKCSSKKNLFIYLQYQLCLLQSNFVKKSNSWFQNVKEKVWSQNYPQIKIFIQYLIGSAMREYPFILVILFLWSPMETVLKRKQTKLFIIYYCFFM